MSENITDEPVDDTEGHGKRAPFLPEEETEDVAGHARYRLTDDEEDVEGHGARFNG